MNLPVDLLLRTPSFQDFSSRWKDSPPGRLEWGGLWGSTKTLFTTACSKQGRKPFLVVAPDPPSADLALGDLKTFGAGAWPLPGREGSLGPDDKVLRDRFRAMEMAGRKGFTGILVAPLHALLQAVHGDKREEGTLELQAGASMDPEIFMRRLVRAGFERVPAVGMPGEFACRGDILDFHAPALGEPIRLEFFDDEIESIRVFDLGTQRTRHLVKHIVVPLTRELAEIADTGDFVPLDTLAASFRVVLLNPGSIEKAGLKLVERFGETATAALRRWEKGLESRVTLALSTLPGKDGSLETLSVEEYCQGVAAGATLLAERGEAGEKTFAFCSTAAEGERLGEIIREEGADPARVEIREGDLESGFRIPEVRLTVLHHREFIPGHGQQLHRPRRKPLEGARIEGAASLRPGDLVVHAVHGLARFQGMESSPETDEGQDVLLLEFAQDARLKVPASRVDLVERYIGAGGGSPRLDRLGSGAFARRKKKVAEAVEDMAAEMLEIQAQRESAPGRSMPGPEPAQTEFEEAFPWPDTPDQVQATRDLHEDLSAPRAMDRLLCGDVGYGKTEIAARAIFRTILSGAQAAILVPTTLLAEQHARSLGERFADWGVEVGHLSRLVPPKTRTKVLKDLEKGRIDLVIGTHRILSRDVRFKDLSLVVIDEEQRFGVKHKEALKKKRAQVDVLTLTATPIPRTLHMALAGIRDISSLETAPAGRLEVRTEIRQGEDVELLREAIERELARGGQIFFVHNRVRTLEKSAARLEKLVPSARIVCGHGQMEPRELEASMLTFVRGEADILCSTTIVESGLDIPNANTIFIDDAHRYGLADLHQLRGRVGRGNRRAWCYLLVPRGKPLPHDAKRRLKAVEELRYLGAGYQIAMRDLEIRGAGNLLGAEQSGHINAVGYETYRRLLRQAVERLRHEASQGPEGPPPACDLSLGIAAALPVDYVADEEDRLSILRDFDSARCPDDLTAVLDGLRDRFGPPPREVLPLGIIFLLKHCLGERGFASLHPGEKGRLLCALRDPRKALQFAKKGGFEFRRTGPRRGVWILPPGIRKGRATLDYLFETISSCQSTKTQRKSFATPDRP